MYYALRSIFGEGILFILCTTQYFRGVDTIHTMHYVVFSRSGYYLYYALCSIFGEWILFILCTTQYLRGVDTFCTMPTQYFREVDAFYTVYFAVFSRGGY